MLLVGEVRRVHPQLLRPVGTVEGCRQVQQGHHGRGHGLKVLHGLLPADVQQALQLFRLRLAAVPDLLQRRHLWLVLPAPGGVQAGEFDPVHRLPGFFPGLCLPQSGEAPGGGQEFLPIACPKGRVVLRPLRRLCQQGRPVSGLAVDRHQQLPGVGRRLEIVTQVRPHGPVFLQPTVRIGVALQFFVQVQHQGRCHGPPLAAAVLPQHQKQRQQYPHFSVVAGPADSGQHRVQKAAAQVILHPIQDEKFRRLHGSLLRHTVIMSIAYRAAIITIP